jgi:hypothetical protein
VFPSPHIAVVLLVPLLCVLCFTLGRLTAPKRRRTNGLYLRPGFWLTRTASQSGNPATVVTLPPGETSTVCRPDGGKWADAARPASIQQASSFTAPGFSTGGVSVASETGGNRGHGTPGKSVA